MFLGFKTKEKIKKDWIDFYGKNNENKQISDFVVGAERIVYALLNGKGIGQPNSAPVGSDLFFEIDDAYIHIDMKTVQKENINDFAKAITIGKNQNSYKGEIKTDKDEKREYVPSLPTYYNKGGLLEKICLSYFITILYDRDDLNILVIAINSMPNGELEKHYKTRVLKPGKNKDKARFNISEVNKFELLKNKPSRIKVVYFNESMEEKLKKKLTLFKSIYNEEKNI